MRNFVVAAQFTPQTAFEFRLFPESFPLPPIVLMSLVEEYCLRQYCLLAAALCHQSSALPLRARLTSPRCFLLSRRR